MTTPQEEPMSTPSDPSTETEVSTASAPDEQTGQDHPETFPRAYVEQLRKEQKQRREHEAQLQAALEAANARLKQFEDATLSEEEKRNRELEDLRTQTVQGALALRDSRLETAVVSAATRLGIVDPDAALALLKKDAVTWDGNNPTNVTDLLTTLKEQRPWLAGRHGMSPPPDTGATNPSSGAGGGQRGGQPLTVEAIRKMSPDEMNTRWAEVSAVLASMRR